MTLDDALREFDEHVGAVRALVPEYLFLTTGEDYAPKIRESMARKAVAKSFGEPVARFESVRAAITAYTGGAA